MAVGDETRKRSRQNELEAAHSAYQRYISSLCLRNPSLQNLHYFLGKRPMYGMQCRACVFDFYEDARLPVCRDLKDADYLSIELRSGSSDCSAGIQEGFPKKHQVLGRVIIIEDLTPAIIALLGSELDIDPLFFAMHLHIAQRKSMRRQTPHEATLPSRLMGTTYINASYHRSVQHCDEIPGGGRLLRHTIIDRKLVFLPHTKIALAQHCASVFKVERPDDSWLAIILVDPPIRNEYWIDGQKGMKGSEIILKAQPYLGEFEDFLAPPTFSEIQTVEFDHVRGGMFEDMKHYWSRELPPEFDPKNPSLMSLAFYPLKIAAAEWSKYVTVMHNCIKQYEYQSDKLPDLAKFDTNLYELQSWRRRSMYSQQKIRTIISTLRSRRSTKVKAQDPCVDSLLVDYEFVAHGIQEAGQRLENMLPVVTSLVSIADARHSFAETANISRLTVLALVFVPLSFVSSLFSMNSNNAPGSQYFWVYFAVAIPVTLVVFCIARPPHRDLVRFYRWTRARMSQEHQKSSEYSLSRVMTEANMAMEKDV